MRTRGGDLGIDPAADPAADDAPGHSPNAATGTGRGGIEGLPPGGRLPRSKAAILWSDWFWLWQVYVVSGCAAAIAIVFIVPGRSSDKPFAASAALVGLAIWAITYGRMGPGGRRTGRRAGVFVAGALALWAIALVCTPSSLAALPVIYPLVFAFLPLRAAIAVTLIVNILPVFVIASAGLDTPGLPMATALSLLALVLSPLIGVWITRTVVQSEERAALLDALVASQAEAARLSREAGTAAERARLAREIHDTLAQGFASIVTLGQAVETELDADLPAARRHVGLIRTTAQDNLAEARAMVEALTPSALSAGTLVDAIQRLGNRLTAETGIEVTVSAQATLPDMSTAEEVVLLRATQEALTNVRKHARASAVTVDLSRIGERMRLSVSDNGEGFDNHGQGFGLLGLQARAEQIGGTTSVRSRPGTGTTIEVEIPT